MKLLSFFKPILSYLLLLVFLLILSDPLCAAQYEEEISTQEYLFIKGVVHTVSTADQTIKIQQTKGPLITIFVNPESEFKGFRKLEELQTRQNVKIWYRPATSGNIGLKILRLPELGC